ncbi:MAG: OmpH family outer membrane protein [Flavobacteriales bacterium]
MKNVTPRVFWATVGALVVWLGALTWSPVVAFVHGDSLQAGMTFVQTMQANLQMQLENREARLQEDALPLQEEAQELLDYANSGQATEDELAIAQRRVMEIETALRQLQRAAEEDMFVAEQNMKSVLADALRRHLQAHAEEEGLDLILNWGLSGEGVLYGSEPWDVTAEVLDRINEAHPGPSAGRPIAEESTTEE